MERIDYDAGESSRIEQSLLKVELPGAVLLRHQPALQTVRKPRDYALQVRELLVQIAAQPFELLWFAQVLVRNGLVGFCDEAAIVRPARLVLALSARAPRRLKTPRTPRFRVLPPLPLVPPRPLPQ